MIYYQNVNGLRTKISELIKNIAINPYHIYILTESSLTPDIHSSELGFHNCQVFRKDRDLEATGKSRGGGVLVAVHDSINVQTLNYTHTDSSTTFEELWLLITYGKLKMVLGAVYIPPASNKESYQFHCDSTEFMASTYSDAMLCIIGDYNLPEIIWWNDDLGLLSSGHNSSADCLIESFPFLNLFQLNTISNANNVMLDLVFSSNSLLDVSLASDYLVKCDKHHPAIAIFVPCNKTYQCLEFEEFMYNFKNCNFNDINDYLLNVHWDTILNSELNTSVELFYLTLSQCFDMFVPKMKIKSKFKFPIWFDDDLKQNTINKRAAHRQYKITRNIDDYNHFSNLRAVCKEQASICYRNYINEIENSVLNDPRIFWDYVRDKNKEDRIPNTMSYLDEIAEDGKSIANLFAMHFASVYDDSLTDNTNSNIDIQDTVNGVNVNSLYIGINEVLDKLINLDCKKGPGPDEISAYFLKYCAFALSRPLWLLFNKSLSEGIFPTIWKSSYIVPIYKKTGDKGMVINYRPITRISHIPKIFESLVNDYLTFKLKNCITSKQHGFFQGRSITTNLLIYQDFIANSLEKGYCVDSIYTDFSKAFDKVDHALLLNELSRYICGSLLLWLRSYLSNRVQVVKINNHYSNEIQVRSGVPQGAHLAPLLFNLFINDVVECFLHCQILMYADDLKIYKEIKDLSSVVDLQNDITRFQKWCKRKKLNLNISKCKYIQFNKGISQSINSYTMNDTLIENVKVIRDLGIYFDSKLTFVHHIDLICNRALKLLGFIKRHTKEFSNIIAIKTLYISLVRSHLENCSVIWSPYFQIHIDKVERVQKRFLRYIAFKLNIPIYAVNYNETLNILHLHTLEHRRINADIILAYKISNGIVDCPELLSMIDFYVPQRQLRETYTFSLQYHRTLYGANLGINRIVTNANTIQLDFFNITIDKLKRNLI